MDAWSSMGKPVLVSACLLGVPCRYDGKSKAVALAETRLVPVCPEVMAGFGVPRPAIQRSAGGRVVLVETGEDVTEQLGSAVDAIVAMAGRRGIRRARLKQNSPSCGSTHTWIDGALQPGEGVLTERLRAAGIIVEGEDAGE